MSPHRLAVLSLVVDHLDFASLSAQPTLLEALHAETRDAVAQAAGGISSDRVHVTLAPGSVAVHAVVQSQPQDAQLLVLRLQAARHELTQGLSQRVSRLEGIDHIKSGPIAVRSLRVSWAESSATELAARPKAEAGGRSWLSILGNAFLALLFICCCLPFLAGMVNTIYNRSKVELGTGPARAPGYHRADEWYKPVMVMDQLPPLLPPGVGGLMPASSGGPLAEPAQDWHHTGSAGHFRQENYYPNSHRLQGPDASYNPWVQPEQPPTRPSSSNQPVSPGVPLSPGAPRSPASTASGGRLLFPGGTQMDLLQLPASPGALPSYLQPRIVEPSMTYTVPVSTPTGPFGSMVSGHSTPPASTTVFRAPVATGNTSAVVDRMLWESTGAAAGIQRGMMPQQW